MKIAILTQPLGQNYGGIMQAYALQKVLRDFGHEVVTINRWPDKRSVIVRLALPFKPLIYKLLGRKPVRKLSADESKYIYMGMTDFVKKYINLSEVISSTTNLKSHYNKHGYDLVVVGSDQVWRPKYSPNIYNFFGDFLEEDAKCISYGASFGVDVWEFEESQTRSCRELVKRFGAVSVRESSAVDLCQEKLGVQAQQVLDPTLLLGPEDYEKLLGDLESTGETGVLKYILDNSEQKTQLVQHAAKCLGIKIFSAQPARHLSDQRAKNIDELKYPQVQQWVMSFRNAEFVVTDSFHGCVFSIIFNKPFLVVGNAERGLSRFNSLLQLFGLEDRLVSTAVDLENLKFNDNDIDWGKVNHILNIERAKSMAFISSWV